MLSALRTCMRWTRLCLRGTVAALRGWPTARRTTRSGSSTLLAVPRCGSVLVPTCRRCWLVVPPTSQRPWSPTLPRRTTRTPAPTGPTACWLSATSVTTSSRPGRVRRPTSESEAMESDPAATDDSDPGTDRSDSLLVFGDFSNYVIADRLGTTVEFIPHLFQQATAGSGVGMPTGQRGWYAYARVGADAVNPAAFRLLQA